MTEKFELIKGNYTPSEAADVLLSLLNDKIKFHSLKMMNLKDEDIDVSASEKRYEELKSFKRVVEKMVMAAHHNYMNVKINGTIELELVDLKPEGKEIDLPEKTISKI